MSITNSVIVLPVDTGNSGKNIDCNQLTVNAKTVQRQNFCIADPQTAANVAQVDTLLTLCVGGLVAAGATASGNPVPMGAQYVTNANNPAYTTGQASSLQTDAVGILKTGTMPLGTPIYAGAASGGAAAATATLTIPTGAMGYLDGFDVDGLGATSGSAIALTATGILGGTLTWQFGVPAGVTTPVHQSFRFNPPLQASATHTNIVVSAASFGSGNTQSSVVAFGHYV